MGGYVRMRPYQFVKLHSGFSPCEIHLFLFFEADGRVFSCLPSIQALSLMLWLLRKYSNVVFSIHVL